MLTTNIEAQKSVTIYATATVAERFELQPASVYLPGAPVSTRPAAATQPAGETLNVVLFTINGNKPVKVIEALSDDPAIKVAVVPLARSPLAAASAPLRRDESRSGLAGGG